MKKIIIAFIVILLCMTITAQAQIPAAVDTVTMRAPGTSAAVWCAGFSKVTWYFTIASINTSVAVALQAKKGNGPWVSIFSDSLVYTTNGDHGITWTELATADSLRYKWLTEAGGTDATITHNAGLSGGR